VKIPVPVVPFGHTKLVTVIVFESLDTVAVLEHPATEVVSVVPANVPVTAPLDPESNKIVPVTLDPVCVKVSVAPKEPVLVLNVPW
jgi:hypothetical protein